MQQINKIEPLKIIEMYVQPPVIKIVEKNDEALKIIEKKDLYKYNLASQMNRIFNNSYEEEIIGFVGNYKWFHYYHHFFDHSH